jgi:bifunctional non-homologous end joining protein LigD
MKYDGYRCLLAIGGGEARTYTRSGLDWSDHFKGVIKAALTLKVDTALIDGEAVALDAEGKSSFHALQALLKGGHADVVFYAFDLLELDKEDLEIWPVGRRSSARIAWLRLSATLSGTIGGTPTAAMPDYVSIIYCSAHR